MSGAKQLQTLIFASVLATSINLSAQCIGQGPFNLTFSEFPIDTSIGTQYSNKGVIFTSPSFITSDSANPTSPVLSGVPRFFGSIMVKFVSPSNLDMNSATTGLSFDAGFFDQIGATTVQFYDINNASLGSIANSAGGVVRFNAPEGVHAFSIGTVNDSAGFAIDNISYSLSGSNLKISTPNKDQVFGLMINSLTRTSDISFGASGPAASGRIAWKVIMEYDTDISRGLPVLESTFGTSGTGSYSLYYQSRGGRGRVAASDSSNTTACPLEYFYVLGTNIPAADVTARLISLYANGATPRLLTGVARVESGYRQFSNRTKYLKNGLWPLESAQDGGSHVGLMQVPTSGPTIKGEQGVKNAWDWRENTDFASNLFKEKIRIASSLERKIRNQNKGLRALTNIEIENMALTLYGPFAAAGSNMQYYTAVQLPSGDYDWIVNLTNNSAGVGYADSVRANIQ